MEGLIHGQVEVWREGGTWRLMLRLPRWVVEDMARAKSFQLTNQGYGGTGRTSQATMMLEEVDSVEHMILVKGDG